jgi:hypothetical protein
LVAPRKAAAAKNLFQPILSLAQVGPPYVIEKDGSFRKGDQRGVDFATGRLALGAHFARA